MKPILQTIFIGDCLKILDKFPNDYFDVIVTSPPYNLNIKYRSYKDNLKRLEFLSWMDQISQKIKSKTKNNGSFFINVGGSNKDPWISMDIANEIRKNWMLQNHIIWSKSIDINNITYGHFKPINSDRFLNLTHENIFHFTKTGNIKIDRKAIGVPYTDKSNITRWKSGKDDLRCRGNVWFIPYPTISRKMKGYHPAIFPEKLVEMCIKLHGYDKNMIICDPFCGIGTSLFVAKKLNINAIGIELDKDYVNFTKKQLQIML